MAGAARSETDHCDEPSLVGADDIVDIVVRDVFGVADGEDTDTAVLAAAFRAAVAAALPAGVSLRGLQFTGPPPSPEHAAAAIRAAISTGGAVDVLAHLESDAQAARLLRSAVRRTEAELARLRAAQRENAQRRVAEGVPKARTARDLGVQRVTVDAWLRAPAPAEPAPPTPTPTGHASTAEPIDPTPPASTPTTPANTADAVAAPATPRPRRTGDGRSASTTSRGPALLRFDPATVRLQRWPDQPGGWLVHATDPDGRVILIGHLTRQDKLNGRTQGWQPLDEQRHRITGIRPLPKTRPDAVAAILRAHEQRHVAATRQRRIDKAVHLTGR